MRGDFQAGAALEVRLDAPHLAVWQHLPRVFGENTPAACVFTEYIVWYLAWLASVLWRFADARRFW